MPNSFVQRHADKITGILRGFDRLVFRGTLRRIAYPAGMKAFLWLRKVLLVEFGDFAQAVTADVRAASIHAAEQLRRPVIYLESSQTSKEDTARAIAQRDGIDDGLVCVLSCVEPCMSYDIFRNRAAQKLELVLRKRKCLFLYHYLVDPVFGFMNVRVQTWFPFPVQICINGREWLARQMDRAGLEYRRHDNCFPWIEDFDQAQKLMDRQRRTPWRRELGRIARIVNPVAGEIFRGFPIEYYWSTHQSEWATDLAFENPAALGALYPRLLGHAIRDFGSGDVMRFLGRKVHGAFRGEIVSDFKDRPEGLRVKHRVGANSVKMYDKGGSLLRIETTINETRGYKSYRRKEGDPTGPLDWRQLRKGTADLNRRAEVSNASNERYLEALAGAETEGQTLGELLAPVCRRTTWGKARVRGLRPWADDDRTLLGAVLRGEFRVNGVRNRDLQPLLYSVRTRTKQEARRRSGRVSRLLRLLRAHGILAKVPRTHRYQLTTRGTKIAAAVLAADRASVKQLGDMAA